MAKTITDYQLYVSVLSVAVYGTGHLADATRDACERLHELAEGDYCDVLWFCVDTPVGVNDAPDVDAVLAEMGVALADADPDALVLVSSQLPVGTCARMEERWPDRRFAVQPENIRKVSALKDLLHQERIIVGTRRPEDEGLLCELLTPLSDTIVFMSPESAEMTKHALNAFLALNIVFANEIADVCRSVGADVDDVSSGFRSDRRVGNGPLKPGRGFEGGTLGRDVTVLRQLGAGPVISSIRASNSNHL